MSLLSLVGVLGGQEQEAVQMTVVWVEAVVVVGCVNSLVNQ
jgi:hypothetical protein